MKRTPDRATINDDLRRMVRLKKEVRRLQKLCVEYNNALVACATVLDLTLRWEGDNESPHRFLDGPKNPALWLSAMLHVEDILGEDHMKELRRCWERGFRSDMREYLHQHSNSTAVARIN